MMIGRKPLKSLHCFKMKMLVNHKESICMLFGTEVECDKHNWENSDKMKRRLF